MILDGARNLVCPSCSNGAKHRARTEDQDYPIAVYALAVLAADVCTYANGEQEMMAAEQVDQGPGRRWATCGACDRHWTLSPGVQPDAVPLIEPTN